MRHLNKETIKKVFCAFYGHSHIYKSFMGYHHCSRCGELVGDTLGGAFHDNLAVNVDCNCERCFENYPKLSWKDKFLCPYPFEKDENGVVRVISREERHEQMHKAIEDMRKRSEIRRKRTKEFDGLWDRLPKEVLIWVQSQPKEECERLLNASSEQDIVTVDEYFIMKYKESLSPSPLSSHEIA